MQQTQMTQTQRNTEAILRRLREYLDLRFAHASRLNEHFRRVQADVLWHELDLMRHVLNRDKPVGEKRRCVSDMLVSMDPELRRQIFAVKGQLTIINEVVPVKDELIGGESGLAVKDLMTFYRSIDPFLKSTVELLQTWVWWDLPDSLFVHIFESQYERVLAIARAELSENLLNFYAEQLDTSASSLDRTTILQHEFNKATEAAHLLSVRRSEDEMYQQIIAREKTTTQSPADPMIMQLAQHLKAREMLAGAEQVDASLRDYYARALGCAPGEVERQRALDYEDEFISRTKHELIQKLMEGDEGGEPYNFKKRQAQDIAQRCEAVQAELGLKGRGEAAREEEGGGMF